MINFNRIRLQPNEIINIVINKYGIRESVLKSKTRMPKIVKARKYACYFLAKYTDISKKSISEQVGYKSNGSHATVIYHQNDVEGKMQIYKDVRVEIESIDFKIKKHWEKLFNIEGYTVKDAIENPEILKDYK